MVRQIKRKMDKRAVNEARRKELRASLAVSIEAEDMAEAKRLQAELIKLSPKDGQRNFSSKSECEDPFSSHLVEHYSRPDHLGRPRTAIGWMSEFSKEIRADIGHHGLVPGVATIVTKALADAGSELDDAGFKSVVRAVSIKIADRIQGIGMLFVERQNQSIRITHSLGPDVAKAMGLPPALPRFDAEKQDVWVKRNVKTDADYEQIFEEGWAKYLAQLEPEPAEAAAVEPAVAVDAVAAVAAVAVEPISPEVEVEAVEAVAAVAVAAVAVVAAAPAEHARPEPVEPEPVEPEPVDVDEPEPAAPKPAKARTVVMSDMMEDA